jgi:hypothetical protein
MNVLECSMDEPFFDWQAGESVPQVEPEDVKAVWTLVEDVEKKHPARPTGIGAEFVKANCRPGRDVSAVWYRAAMLRALVDHSGEQLAAWIREGQPGPELFRAAAQTSMKWIGVGVDHEGFPFDVDELLRLARGETTG